MNEYNIFLGTLPERLPFLGVGYRLNEYAQNKKEYRKNISNTDFFMIEVAVLMFLDNENIIGIPCFRSDIKEFIAFLCSEKKINVNVEELTKDLIESGFRNDGKVYIIESSAIEISREINIITEEYNNENKMYEFFLSDETKKWLYSSYEIEKVGQISIQSIIMKRELAAGNIDNAISAAKKQLSLIIGEIRKMSKRKDKILCDGEDTSNKKVVEEFNSSINIMKEQKEEIERIRKKVKNFNPDDFDKIHDEEKIRKTQKSLQELSKIIDKSITKQANLLTVCQEAYNIYIESLMDFSFLDETEFINPKKNILDKMKKYPSIEFNLFEVLRPLFPPKKKRFFNLNTIVSPQKIIKDKEEVAIDIDDINILDFEDTEKEIREALKEKIRIENFVFSYIIEDLIKFKKTTILKTFNNHKELAEYIEEIKDICNILMSKEIIIFDKKELKEPIIYNFEPEKIQFFMPEKNFDLIGKKVIVSSIQGKLLELEGIYENLKTQDIEFKLIEMEE